MTDEISRRGFLELSGAAGMAALSSGGFNQQRQPTQPDRDVDRYGVLIGPSSQRPDPGGAYLSQFDTYQFAYFATDTGAKSYKTEQDDSWNSMANKITDPNTQVDEVRVEDYQSFFNHTFARPEAPDSKNWMFTPADVTSQNSEIELASTTTVESTQRGNYPPGTEAIPGVAWRVTGTPTSGSGIGGYFDDNNGFGAGEDSTDSYVFIRKAGVTHKVYRTDWNGHVPSERVWTSSYPVITRFPHLFYGGGAIKVRALLHENGNTELRTLHTFTPENVPDTFDPGPPFDQPNLPIAFESNSLLGGNVRANAAHYEFGESDTENRINGEHFTGDDESGVDVSDTGWTPILAWQKRDAWDMVNVKPLKISLRAVTNDVKLEVQLDPVMSGNTWARPENTSSSETSVEVAVDGNLGTLDTVGERRWVGYTASGQGNQSSGVRENDLDFNLPAGQIVVLTAQGVGGPATVFGTVGWEEFF